MSNDSNIREIVVVMETEHPQIASVLLACLPSETAGKIISKIPVFLAMGILERVYNSGQVDRQMLEKLSERFETWELEAARLEIDKNTLLLGILDHCGYLRQREIILGLEENFSINLSYKDVRIMEDLMKLDGPILNKVLSKLDLQTLTLALRIVPEELKTKILGLMPRETAAEIRSDLDWSGPVLLDDIAKASKKLIDNVNNVLHDIS